ncbi:hypothetical protein ScPMuIL_001788 [Solemya velum]
MAHNLTCSLGSVFRTTTSCTLWGRLSISAKRFDGSNAQAFNEKLLDILACPLSKKPLRYKRETHELISEEIGVAYPIVNGIPNLLPQDARMIKTGTPLNDVNLKRPDN